MIGRLYYQDSPFTLQTLVNPGKLPIGANAGISSTALVGTLCGQLFWGWFSDKFGRRSAYGLTLAFMVVAGVCQGMTFGPTTEATAVIGTLCFWRFLLGFGVGGDYPVSATMM